MVTRNGFNTRKKNNNSDVECLDAYEAEDDGFIEGDINFGKAVATFNFGNNTVSMQKASGEPVLQSARPINNTAPAEINTYTPVPRGLTPPVNGELFTVKRCYQFRPSTLRKLNELKANHPDVNAYLNTILDAAILHYYNHILGEKRS